VTAPQVPSIGNLGLADKALSDGWDLALRLAWEAFAAHTTPVGAVAVDGDGEVVAAGRGRRYEAVAPDGQLAGTHIAHAEVNALAQLSSARHWDGTLLLTTLEPCAKCYGAAIQSTVAGLCFAGRDPYGGTGGLRFETPQARRRDFLVTGPLPGPHGALAEILHIAFLMIRASSGHVVAAQRAALPQVTGYTERVASMLQNARRRDDYASALEIAAAAPRDVPRASAD
jgi:tRNA(Arg) A34 adenosine deaminase TadA